MDKWTGLVESIVLVLLDGLTHGHIVPVLDRVTIALVITLLACVVSLPFVL
jgi:ABC-type uncharacterized transport system permease subunit